MEKRDSHLDSYLENKGMVAIWLFISNRETARENFLKNSLRTETNKQVGCGYGLVLAPGDFRTYWGIPSFT